MAIDTRDRRAAVINFLAPWINLGPDPDGGIDTAPDRELMGHAYNGFTLSGTLPAGRGRKRRQVVAYFSPLSPPHTMPPTHPILPWER